MQCRPDDDGTDYDTLYEEAQEEERRQEDEDDEYWQDPFSEDEKEDWNEVHIDPDNES